MLSADSALREREDRNVAALVAHIDALYDVLQGEALPSPEAKVPSYFPCVSLLLLVEPDPGPSY